MPDPSPLLQPGGGKPLAITARFDEVLLQPLDLAIQKIVRLVN
jgi:hypothetical protein